MVSVGVQTYARARIFLKDRETLEPAVQLKTAEQTTNGKGLLTIFSSDSVKTLKTELTDCFPGAVSNEYCFENCCMPLIENALKGFKALLIAYGQTGTGKTFSLIGAHGPGQLGLLPRTVRHFCKSDRVLEIRMKAFEAYSATLTKIPLFDLFDPVNTFMFEPFIKPGDDKAANRMAEYKWLLRKSAAAKALWGSKKGRRGINTLIEGHFKVVEDAKHGMRLIESAHDASHFANTGKNPASSRGHTVYILILKIKSPDGEDYDPVQTEFVVVDLAGSEGGSTYEGMADGPDKTARWLEGGVINFGLTSLKDMFAEMRKKGKLKKSQGNGLRKMLYPFVTSKTMMSILFTLSPSMSNIMATRATMKFAADACKLKLKPVAAERKKNWEKLSANDGGGASSDRELYSKFCQMFEANADSMYAKVQEFGIDSCLSDEVMKAVQESLQVKKQEYIDRLRVVYENYAGNTTVKVDDVPGIVEEQISKGVSLQTYYEIICDQFKQTAEKEVRHETLLTAEDLSSSHHTSIWMKKAEHLRERTIELIKEDEITDDIIVDSFEAVEIGGTGIPSWFMEFDEETQVQTEAQIQDAMNMKGEIPKQVSWEIMETLKIDLNQMEDLRTYMLIKRGEDHDAKVLQLFKDELGEDATMDNDMLRAKLHAQQEEHLRNDFYDETIDAVRDSSIMTTSLIMDLCKKHAEFDIKNLENKIERLEEEKNYQLNLELNRKEVLVRDMKTLESKLQKEELRANKLLQEKDDLSRKAMQEKDDHIAKLLQLNKKASKQEQHIEELESRLAEGVLRREKSLCFVLCGIHERQTIQNFIKPAGAFDDAFKADNLKHWGSTVGLGGFSKIAMEIADITSDALFCFSIERRHEKIFLMSSTVLILSIALFVLSTIVDIVLTARSTIRMRNIVRARYGLWMLFLENIPQICFAFVVLLSDTFEKWAYVTIIISIVATISRIIFVLSVVNDAPAQPGRDTERITDIIKSESASSLGGAVLEIPDAGTATKEAKVFI